jgi:ribosomal RNA-processing protein 9
VLGIDSFIKERCVTCGARDRSVRMWKIVEESQLVFNGTHFDSIDCISMLNEELFLTGSNDGTLAIWCINKKKPLSTIKNAHQKSSCSNELDNTKSNFNGVHILNGISNYKSSGWISSLCAYHNSDLIASGSDDGYIRVWQYIASTNSLKELFTIEAVRYYYHILNLSFYFVKFQSFFVLEWFCKRFKIFG